MKEKGFTLVELLAVIVILAVISLIATPMVLGVIEKSKISAAIESANGILDAAEKNMIESMLNGESKTRYDLSNDTSLLYKGEKPESGILLIDDKGKMSIKAKINGYCVLKTYNGTTPIIVDDSICEGNYKETILNGTDPVLKDSLIPVTIKDNGEVTYADITTEWYDYENKVWANAVILVSSPSRTYVVGDTILESDIESYFVWIPKYSYKLWDLGNYDSVTDIDTSKVHSIDIVFGTENTSDTKEGECTTPLTSGASGNCAVGDYMTHPAFITLGVNGIWVGKFETTGDTVQLTVKPSNVSLRNLNIASMFDLSLNYKTLLNSHMMKNTEWGAVAYISHSTYGINTEITINNCSNYVTGIGGDSVSASSSSSACTMTANRWAGEKGKLASTTGNISGIYDMAGGTYEYVAAYINGKSGNSGFSTLPTGNYIDIYVNSEDKNSNYTGRILGDALGEMGPFKDSKGSWYSDISINISSEGSWIKRGGIYSTSTNSGIFHFNASAGAKNNDFGFRLVLAP